MHAPDPPGKNDPCPCGSGKKYRKCCGKNAPPTPASRAVASHRLDERLVLRLLRHAKERLGERWRASAEYPGNADMESPEVQLFVPWSVYVYRVDGRTVVERFLAGEGGVLTPEERAWLEAQQRAWLSVWEVTEVTRDVGVAVQDLLTGEKRFLNEVLGSRVLERAHALLARVADFENCSVFAGMHPTPLSPDRSVVVARQAGAELGVVGRDVPVERLRAPGADVLLVKMWTDAVEEMCGPANLPRLRNTDGEDVLMTTDRFDIVAGKREEVAQRLAALEGAERGEGEEQDMIRFLRSGNAQNPNWKNTLVGHAEFAQDTLKVETNSLARADVLRRLVEGACTGLLAHRSREHVDQEAMHQKALEGFGPRPATKTAEMIRVVREFKAEHYRGWLDQPIPALGNETPRRAARNARSREMLDQLLKEMEFDERRMPEAEQYDFSALRRELGLGR